MSELENTRRELFTHVLELDRARSEALQLRLIADAAVTKLLAVRERVEAMRDDCAHHESKESSPAEIRTYKGWVNVDDYATDILDILDKEIR